MVELKPCPFCGGEAILETVDGNSPKECYILHAPAVDAVVVTRCKDCKHRWEDIGGLCCGYGPLVDCIVPEDFFCAYGKPKEV